MSKPTSDIESSTSSTTTLSSSSSSTTSNSQSKKLLSFLTGKENEIAFETAADRIYKEKVNSFTGTWEKKGHWNSTVSNYNDLTIGQMTRVALWGLGGIPWIPRQPNQKGIRILSLDGGGTKGVCAVAILAELFGRAGKTRPADEFDIICGTSTGGIIASLLGLNLQTVNEVEALYDTLIDDIFGKGSNVKLLSEQAFYDENEWERILHDLCDGAILLDSNQENVPRVFCVSSKVNVNPPVPMVWRNFNYPVGQYSRYPGSFRVNTQTSIRASTAAPTFFTPIQWEGGLYCDGAIVANNPSAIAVQEAKALYPNVPIELLISIGTGVYIGPPTGDMKSMNWNVLVSQIVASATDSEDIHNLLRDFLSPNQYFRINPLLDESIAIDEKSKDLLSALKEYGRNSVALLEKQEPERYNILIKALSGK